jgi:hypothetical protein
MKQGLGGPCVDQSRFRLADATDATVHLQQLRQFFSQNHSPIMLILSKDARVSESRIKSEKAHIALETIGLSMTQRTAQVRTIVIHTTSMAVSQYNDD